jgi:hypothetical protein
MFYSLYLLTETSLTYLYELIPFKNTFTWFGVIL